MSAPFTRPVIRLLARAVMHFLTRTSVTGREHLPASGPLLVAFNHLGHLDAVVLIASMPYDMDAIALSDLFSVPITGFMLRLYGAIPVHRDAFDRSVVDKALAVLSHGGVLFLAPESRMSVTGALEKARDGAGYLALKSRSPILPVALTGAANGAVYGAWKRRRRPQITLTIGEAFSLPELPLNGPQRRQNLDSVTTTIMTRLAELLPAEYRGVYANKVTR